ncbi:DUF4229 domain-containing protein [Leifsonia sp. 2TAF2]|uniref:DUF4229 domain-containing protein n=1 Tax=Leifsonia sp. 2TAF2 TaxID=3233009 RepID=UPI003F995A2B
MKRIPSWITYTVLRLLVFAVPLAILLLLGLVWWLAVIAAALIGLCLSYIFLSRPRNAVSSELYAVRHREKPVRSEDDDAEDAALDADDANIEADPKPDTDTQTERGQHGQNA